MNLESRIEKIEEKLGGGKKPSREEILKAAWERFLTSAGDKEVSDARINFDGELDEHTKIWLEFLERGGEKL